MKPLSLAFDAAPKKGNILLFRIQTVHFVPELLSKGWQGGHWEVWDDQQVYVYEWVRLAKGSKKDRSVAFRANPSHYAAVLKEVSTDHHNRRILVQTATTHNWERS